MIDQGTILDSVEYNVELAAVNVEEAVGELQVATRCGDGRGCCLLSILGFRTNRYQKNTSRRQCMILLALLILGLVLVLIFKPRRHSSATEPAGEVASPGATGC